MSRLSDRANAVHSGESEQNGFEASIHKIKEQVLPRLLERVDPEAAATLTKDEERVSLQVLGDGPLGSLTVDAGSAGTARGYVKHPHVALPAASVPSTARRVRVGRRAAGNSAGSSSIQRPPVGVSGPCLGLGEHRRLRHRVARRHASQADHPVREHVLEAVYRLL